MRRAAGPMVAAATALVLAAAARAVADFRLPEKTVYCGVVEAYEVPPAYLPPLTCWRPRNGFTVFLPANRRPFTRWNPHNRGAYLYAVHVLLLGQRWWADRGRSGLGAGSGRRLIYRCVSRASGLACVNLAGHGFWLGRTSGYQAL